MKSLRWLPLVAPLFVAGCVHVDEPRQSEAWTIAPAQYGEMRYSGLRDPTYHAPTDGGPAQQTATSQGPATR